MKQRIKSAVIGLLILGTVIFFYGTPVLNLAISVIAILAVDELIAAAGYTKNRPLSYAALLFAGLIPFFGPFFEMGLLTPVCFLFALYLFCLFLKQHKTLKIEQLSYVLFVTLMVPLSLTTFAYMRDLFGEEVGMYGVVMVLVGAWLSDTGAYFFGIAFGKHKLAPEISPKKTIEGAAGGVVVALLAQILAAWIYASYLSLNGVQAEMNYPAIILISPILSVLSIIGDLSASVIKRQFGIKDFGKIMPGHGGVMDRFDSVLMVIPFVYIAFRYLTFIRIL